MCFPLKSQPTQIDWSPTVPLPPSSSSSSSFGAETNSKLAIGKIRPQTRPDVLGDFSEKIFVISKTKFQDSSLI